MAITSFSKKVMLGIEAREPLQRFDRLVLRQAHIHAVIELERPAPLGDECPGPDALAQRAGGIDQFEIFRKTRLRTFTDDLRQRQIARIGAENSRSPPHPWR